MIQGYCKFPKATMAATHWVSLTTGELIPFPASHKILWVWMLDRYNFFTGKGGDWFDNQEAIATATGCEISTVKRFIASLKNHGYLTVTKKPLRGCASSNSYVINHELNLPGGKAPVRLLTSKPSVSKPYVDECSEIPLWDDPSKEAA